MDDKENNEQISKDVIEAAITHFAPPVAASLGQIASLSGLTLNPGIAVSLVSVFGLYGFYLQFKQDKLNSFVRFISDNPNEFAEVIVSQPAFQDGFIISLKAYLDARTKEKEELVKQIFLEFTKSDKKEEFDLERYYNTMNLLSFEGVRYLGFLNREIIPDWQTYVKSEMKRLDWQKELTEQSEPLSKYISSWIQDNFNPNSPLVKEKWGYEDGSEDTEKLGKIFAEEALKLNEMREHISEYLSLGILRAIPGSAGGYGGGGIPTEYTLTEFGWNFIQHLKYIS